MPTRKPARSTSNTAKRSNKKTKVALIGFGTVGSSVVRVLAAQKFEGIELTHIFNRNVARKQASKAAKLVPSTTKWTENIDDLLNSNADVIIELTGGLNPTESWLRKALQKKKSVVTANKQLIAYRGPALFALAKANSVQLVYGAAVAGGVPVIPGIFQGLGGDRI